jgi:FkbM family methyltransferase
MALAVGHTGIVHAFEPARASFDLLARLLDMNRIPQVKPVRLALADRIGAADFVEYGSNNELSWAADASRLLSPGRISQNDYAVYSVPIETLDAYVTRQEVFPGVIKIDIEGFEMDALRGGRCLLESTKPALCIDIHHDPRTGESTGPEVEGFLHGLGYKTRRERHALYAEHPLPSGAQQ